MSVVHKAEHAKVSPFVALKSLPERLTKALRPSNASGGRLLPRFKHPNLKFRRSCGLR
jgi:hypothetical protein